MNAEFGFNTEYLKECFKKRKKPEERIYPKKDWPAGYEPTKKEHEEWMEEGTGVPVSFHWEDIGGGKKRGVFTPIKKNMEILTDLEKVLGNGQPVNFKIENSDGELKKVSKKKFARWMEEEKDVKVPPKESLVYGAKGDIGSITYFTEVRSKDGIIKESYYRPRGEEEKQQIKKRQEINRKRRKQELEEKKKDLEQQTQNQESSQTKNSPNSDKQDQQTEKENNSQNQSQKVDNKDNKNIYYGVGVIGLSVLVISMVAVVWPKRKK